MLAHRKKGAGGKYTMFGDIRFQTDKDLETGLGRIWPVFWAAFRWTGEDKYLHPILDEGPAELETLTGDALDMMHLRDTWGKEIAARVKPDTRNDGMRHIAWQMTGDDTLPGVALRRPDRGLGAARVHQHRGQLVDRPRDRGQQRAAARAAGRRGPGPQFVLPRALRELEVPGAGDRPERGHPEPERHARGRCGSRGTTSSERPSRRR